MSSDHEMVREAIAVIVSRKRGDGCVLSFAQSIEVAREVRMGVARVERLAREIPGLTIGRGINYDYYDIEQ